MNRKTVIQIVIIVVAFGASGLVLYNGLFKSAAPPPTPVILPGNANSLTGASTSTPVSGAPVAPSSLLPYGNSINFDEVLYQQHLRYGEYSYPVLSTSTDVGITVGGLIQPLQTAP